VSVCIRLPEQGRDARIATLGPGVTFGEMAILSGEGNARSADVRADVPIACYRLAVDRWEALGRNYPDIALVLFRNLARELSDRLRNARDVIRVLER
jgi:glutaminase